MATVLKHPASPYGSKPDLAWLPTSMLTVDARYQRDAGNQQSRKIINRIKSAFSWRDFGPLIVARRPDGSHAVTDGQHRLQAAMELGLSEVPCSIFPADAIEHEADSFVVINRDRKQVTAIDLYHALVTAGDVETLALRDVLAAAGFRIGRQANPAYHKQGELGCVQTLRMAQRWHGDKALREALTIVHRAYDGGGCSAPIEGDLVAGVVAIVATFAKDDRFNVDRLVETVRAQTSKQWRIAARPFRELHGLRTHDAMRAAILDAYNRGLREQNRLPKFAEGALS